MLTDASAELGVNDVFFGDQDRIPRANTVCIEPDVRSLDLNGVPRRVRVTMRIYVLVYHNEVRSAQDNLEDSMRMTEAIENLIHLDPRLGGLAIHSMVEEIAPGYARKANGLIRATRMSVSIDSQVQLP